MIKLTGYNSEDALLLAAENIETEDDELIEMLTRLRRTFDDTFEAERPGRETDEAYPPP